LLLTVICYRHDPHIHRNIQQEETLCFTFVYIVLSI
jgi:hypothetical protein